MLQVLVDVLRNRPSACIPLAERYATPWGWRLQGSSRVSRRSKAKMFRVKWLLQSSEPVHACFTELASL